MEHWSETQIELTPDWGDKPPIETWSREIFERGPALIALVEKSTMRGD
jgi:hypothetical protein